MTASTKTRLVSVLLVVLSGGYTAQLGVQLHGYGLPLGLMAACCGGVWSSLLVLGDRVAKAWMTTVHRCTVPDCDFTVRLRHTGAAENRTWQEAAASHPDHRP